MVAIRAPPRTGAKPASSRERPWARWHVRGTASKEATDGGLWTVYRLRPCGARTRTASPRRLQGGHRVLRARLQQQGEIEGFEPVFLEPHGGDLAGFFLVRGDQDKLARIRTSDEFRRLNIRATLITEHFGVVGAGLGERIATQLPIYNQQVEELT
jgi:hypothetical protein